MSEKITHKQGTELSGHDNKIYRIGKEYFLPSYLAVVLKKIDKLSITESTLTVSVTLVIRVYIQELTQEQKDFVTQNIRLRFNENEVKLDEDNSQKKKGTDLFLITHRGSYEIDFEPDLKQCPYDRQTIKIKIEMTSRSNSVTGENFRFNLYKHQNMTNPSDFSTMVSFKDDIDRLPEFNIIFSSFHITFEPEIKKMKSGHSIEYYPVEVIHFTLYREPETLLLTCVFPLVVIDFIILCIFLQDVNDLGGKLSNIITILLALFAFLPSYREQIPNVPYITALDRVIYFSVFIILVVLVDLVAFHFEHEHFIHNLIFFTTATLTVLLLLFIITEYIIYRFNRPPHLKEALQTFKVKQASSVFCPPDWKSPNYSLQGVEDSEILYPPTKEKKS
jgi:hypothetical protein